MSEPCLQAVPIAELQITTKEINKNLDRLGSVLEKIAEQGTRIDTIEGNQEILFERLRKIEIAAAKEETKVGFLVAGISAAVSLVTASLVKIFSK